MRDQGARLVGPGGQRLVVLLVAALFVMPLIATPAAAHDGGRQAPADELAGAMERDEDDEAGVEGAIEGVVERYGLSGTVVVLIIGTALLLASTDRLINYLTRAAIELRVSLFALAIIFTGLEFDDTILGLVLAAGGLEGAALGTAIGTGLAIIGVTLALAAIVQPFPVDLPTDYVVLFGLAPIVLVPVALRETLTLTYGIVLVAFFVASFAYLITRERQREQPVFRSTELGEAVTKAAGSARDGGRGRDLRASSEARPAPMAAIVEDRLVAQHTAWLWLGLAVVALVGLVFASMLLEAGSEAIVEGFGIEETVLGATVLTAILTLEDVLLTLEPVRRGVPEIGVGNVIGSVLFSVTGNVGVLTLVSTVAIAPSVLVFHLPAIIFVTAMAAFFMSKGAMTRRHGCVLAGCYVAYWIAALAFFGGAPLGG